MDVTLDCELDLALAIQSLLVLTIFTLSDDF
jgi:hypothetical protein